MITSRQIRAILSSWLRWRSTRRLYAAMPEMKRFREAELEAQRKHGNVKAVQADRKAFITSALKGGR